MSIPGLISALVLLVVVGYIVLRPLLAPKGEEESIASPTRLDELNTQREAVLAAMRELDFDYQTGKLTEADYAERREALVQQGVALLQEIDQLRAESEAAANPEKARVKEKAR